MNNSDSIVTVDDNITNTALVHRANALMQLAKVKLVEAQKLSAGTHDWVTINETTKVLRKIKIDDNV